MVCHLPDTADGPSLSLPRAWHLTPRPAIDRLCDMDMGDLPPQFRPALRALATVIRNREPAVRERVERLRAENPGLSREALSKKLIRRTRARVAATGAASGAAAIAPGIGTVIAVGTITGQGLYAMEQEAELVLGIAMIHGVELTGSDERLLEALAVIGLAGGAVKLRDNVLVAGGERITIAAFRHMPAQWLARAGSDVMVRVLGRALAMRAAASVGRIVPLAIGLAAGAGFDWAAVTLLGRAAIVYYGRAATDVALEPVATLDRLPAAKDLGEVEAGD